MQSPFLLLKRGFEVEVSKRLLTFHTCLMTLTICPVGRHRYRTPRGGLKSLRLCLKLQLVEPCDKKINK